MHEGMINEQGDVVDVSLQRMSRERMADNIRMFGLFAKIKADLLLDHVVGGEKFGTEWLCTWP
jgi:hypothetical protein